MAEIRYNNKTLFNEVTIADSFFKRLIGLLRTKSLNENQGLLLENCKQVHTFGMKFSIDVVFIAKDGIVLYYEEALKPGKVSPYIKDAYWVLEVQSGVFKKYIEELHQKLTINR